MAVRSLLPLTNEKSFCLATVHQVPWFEDFSIDLPSLEQNQNLKILLKASLKGLYRVLESCCSCICLPTGVGKGCNLLNATLTHFSTTLFYQQVLYVCSLFSSFEEAWVIQQSRPSCAQLGSRWAVSHRISLKKEDVLDPLTWGTYCFCNCGLW